MKKLISLLVLALYVGQVSMLHAQTEVPFLPSTTDARCKQWVDSVFLSMNLQDKVGQLFVASFPARADREVKKQIRDAAKKYKVGGLLFADGTPEEQAILTNLAQKNAKVPLVVVFDGERELATRLDGVPVFPKSEALQCIGNTDLVEEYRRELVREYAELGTYIHFASEVEGSTHPIGSCIRVRSYDKDLKALIAGDEPGLVKRNMAGAMQEVLNAVEQGTLAKADIDAKCRRILACKYQLGLRQAPPQLQVSGMNFRIRRDEALALAAKLRRAAVTVLGNHFGVLPLTTVGSNPVAVLSVGEGSDSIFISELRRYSTVPVERLVLNRATTADARSELVRKLRDYKRIIVSVSGHSTDVFPHADFLSGLELCVPMVYAFFTSYREMQTLECALDNASAVVLGHSGEADIQQCVAGVLFAKAPADGRLSMNIGGTFKAGDGSSVTVDMKPGKVIPEDFGMKSNELYRIGALVRSGLEAGAYPGCRVLLLKDGQSVYDKCFGVHSDKDSTAVRPTDMFDLAAVTTTTATLLAVMKLYDQGKLKLTDRVSAYLPFLRNVADKKNITIRDLLLHESGFPPYMRFYLDAIDANSVHGPYAQGWIDDWHRTQVSEHSYYCSNFKFKRGLVSEKKTGAHTLQVTGDIWLNKSFKNTMLQKIARCEMSRKRYVYSDLGFVLLQQVVEAIVKLPMDLYLAKEFYAPMGLQRTMYLPLRRYSPQEIMPTATKDFLRRQDLCGYVHDETAGGLGGISGNAGLFSTAGELGRIYQMLLDGGELDGKRYLSEATCRLFTTETSADGYRGLGFDRPNLKDLKNSSCAASALPSVYGHTGFTGTCVWVDPENRTVFVFLSNSLCPNVWNTKLGEMKIQKGIQELTYESLGLKVQSQSL